VTVDFPVTMAAEAFMLRFEGVYTTVPAIRVSG